MPQQAGSAWVQRPLLERYRYSAGDDLAPSFPRHVTFSPSVPFEPSLRRQWLRTWPPLRTPKQAAWIAAPTVQSAPKSPGNRHKMRRGTSLESMAKLLTNGWEIKPLTAVESNKLQREHGTINRLQKSCDNLLKFCKAERYSTECVLVTVCGFCWLWGWPYRWLSQAGSGWHTSYLVAGAEKRRLGNPRCPKWSSRSPIFPAVLTWIF